VQLTVHLAKTKIGATELAGLGIGDILATDTSVASPLTLSLDGVPRFLGRPGAFQGRKAIQIEAAIDESAAQETPQGDQAQSDAVRS
jgi:flagellar motor switch protein FliM